MGEKKCLGDLACEVKGIAGTVSALSLLCSRDGTGETLTPETLGEAFYHVIASLDRVAEDINSLEDEQFLCRS